jgi:hypothetical protein
MTMSCVECNGANSLTTITPGNSQIFLYLRYFANSVR